MKKKNLSILCSLLLCAIYSQAQLQKTAFGINAGITSALVNGKVNGVNISSDARIGFTTGVVISSNIGKYWSFRPELNFTQKGGIINDSQEGIKDNTILNYLELPLNVAYSKRGKFFFGGGPSLAYALSGKYKITGMFSESGDLKIGNGADADFKPIDVGINIAVGWQLPDGIVFSINYNTGINNISADEIEKDYNSYLGLRIGYMFNKIKK